MTEKERLRLKEEIGGGIGVGKVRRRVWCSLEL